MLTPSPGNLSIPGSLNPEALNDIGVANFQELIDSLLKRTLSIDDAVVYCREQLTVTDPNNRATYVKCALELKRLLAKRDHLAKSREPKVGSRYADLRAQAKGGLRVWQNNREPSQGRQSGDESQGKRPPPGSGDPGRACEPMPPDEAWHQMALLPLEDGDQPDDAQPQGRQSGDESQGRQSGDESQGRQSGDESQGRQGAHPVQDAHPSQDAHRQDAQGGQGQGGQGATHLRACEWLSSALANGPQLQSELMAQAQAAGVSEKSLRRAKTALGVQSKRHGKRWNWIPPTMPDPMPRAADPPGEPDLSPSPPSTTNSKPEPELSSDISTTGKGGYLYKI